MEDNTILPSLKKMRFPAYRTIRRGVRIGEDDITLKQVFNDVLLDLNRVENYREFFGFSDEFPITYLYILAQRAHLAVMLKKEFTIAIPGLIHMNNYLETFGEVKLNSPFDIEVDLKVESKITGSLYPNIHVIFSQEGNQIAKCTSGYLGKRKNKSKSFKTKRINHVIPEITSSDHSSTWDLQKSLGKSYGKVSGDSNPIHTSKLFAKFAGFEHPIIQGWYSVSRVIENAKILINNIEKFNVNFNKPIYLPSSVECNFQKLADNDSSYFFTVSSPKFNLIHLYGHINNDINI